MKMQVKPLVVDVIEDDGMWLELSTMTYYDKDNLEPITKPEVDLEKEICEYFEGWRINYYSETEELLKTNGCTVDIDDVKDIARHFYELGLNTRKEYQ